MNKLVQVLKTRIGAHIKIKELRLFLKEKTGYTKESSVLIDGVWHRAFRYNNGSVLYFQFVKRNELAYVGLAGSAFYDRMVNKKEQIAEHKAVDRQFAIMTGGD